MLNYRYLSIPLVLLLYGCTVVNTSDVDNSGSGSCGDRGCFQQDITADGAVSEVSADIGAESTSVGYDKINPLCGELLCDPDDQHATKCQSLIPTTPQDAAIKDASGDVADKYDANVDAALHDSSDAHYFANTRIEPANNVGPSPLPTPMDDPNNGVLTCQVTENDKGKRVAQCQLGGFGVDNDRCVSSVNCAAGFACVGNGNAGVCRSYCCLNPEACAQGTYCGIQTSLDRSKHGKSILVPVCIPADNCTLLPDPDEQDGCDEGLNCAIVRSNGTTACLKSSNAQAGQPCTPERAGYSSCAQGLVCSKSTNTCLALCRVSVNTDCENGVCQSDTGSLPEGYGVCVTTRKKNR